MKLRVLVLFSLAALLLTPTQVGVMNTRASVAPIQRTEAPELSFTWKDRPIVRVDGANVDIGVGYDPSCLNGPIRLHVAAGSQPELVMDGPRPDFDWSWEVRNDLEVSPGHIAIEVTAVFPGKRDCRKDEVGVMITPISDRFVAARETGRYDRRVVVSS